MTLPPFLTFWSWYHSIKNKKISPTYSVELIFIYNVFKNSNNYSLSSAVSVLKSSSVVLFELLFLDSEESVLSSSLSDFESEDFVLPPFALAAASFDAYKYQDALDDLEQSYKYDKSYNTEYHIAMCYKNLNKNTDKAKEY